MGRRTEQSEFITKSRVTVSLRRVAKRGILI